MPEGIILKGIGGFYYIKTEEGIFECKARGLFRKNGVTPLPGDRVDISVIDKDSQKGNLETIKPRNTELTRPSVANIDQIALVISAKNPEPDFYLVDKLMISAEAKNIKVLLCINKIDLADDKDSKIIMDAYNKASYESILISSKKNIGFEDLKEKLKDRFTVFAGQSGVGKSTILNKIMDSKVMETGSISDKISRGKHTTRHAQILELDTGGLVVDTPGFSSFDIEAIHYNELETYYPEFELARDYCKFKGCSHISEPKCRVKELVDEGQIDKGRYERYIAFYNLLKDKDKYKYK